MISETNADARVADSIDGRMEKWWEHYSISLMTISRFIHQLSTAVQRTELTSMRCHSLKKSFYIDAITFTCSFLYTYIHASWWPTMGDKAHGTRSRCLITKKNVLPFRVRLPWVRSQVCRKFSNYRWYNLSCGYGKLVTKIDLGTSYSAKWHTDQH